MKMLKQGDEVVLVKRHWFWADRFVCIGKIQGVWDWLRNLYYIEVDHHPTENWYGHIRSNYLQNSEGEMVYDRYTFNTVKDFIVLEHIVDTREALPWRILFKLCELAA